MTGRRLRPLAALLVLLTTFLIDPNLSGAAMTDDLPTPDPAAERELRQFDKLWNYADPAATEKKFRALLPAVKDLGDRDLTLQLETQIARTLGLQRKFEDAHAVLDAVEERLTPECETAWVRYLLERGRAFNSAGKKEKAKGLFFEAYTRGKGQEFHHIDAAHMLGIVEEPAKALGWNEKAINLAERAKDPRARGWLGALLNNTGWTYHDMKEYQRALELFEKCRAFHEEHKREPQVRIAKWTVARTLRSLGRLEEALAAQQSLLVEYETAKDQDTGFVDEEIGECLWALDRKEEAKPHFAAAHAILSKMTWIEAARVERLRELAGLPKPPREEDL